ncbi:MAG TPA: hypothetical protein H9717_08095 [Candidatus Eisenbergiella merdipullorum]|uniref:Uncharacterized protein n=1 Tax=Candidatus Eisenbergiella merdipullorum TaxID=2838553 RepID=A0A9D2L181_9FIRM|nr:hypothetical protein [Candidatus Eisenbergiella merdipullorum]
MSGSAWNVKTQSALNNFDEFTMLDSGVPAPYIGFTEEEVRRLCEEYGRDFENVKRWYNGCLLNGLHIYNPRAVAGVMQRGSFQSYWSQTGSYESIVPLANMDFDGLKTAVVTMLSGAAVEADVIRRVCSSIQEIFFWWESAMTKRTRGIGVRLRGWKSKAGIKLLIFPQSPTYISKRKSARSGSDGRSKRGQDADA